MNLVSQIQIVATFFAISTLAGYGADVKRITIDPAVIYKFTVSLFEPREDTQHKHLARDEITAVATILGSAKYEKEIEQFDIERTPYISRYEFVHGYRGDTPKSGKNESGMLTIDARTVYWNDAIFVLSESEAAKLLKLLPKPVNAGTISERPKLKLNK